MAKPIEVPDIEVRPLLDQRGFAVLFDLYVAGQWVGSRHTPEQCEDHLSHIIGVPISATGGTAW